MSETSVLLKAYYEALYEKLEARKELLAAKIKYNRLVRAFYRTKLEDQKKIEYFNKIKQLYEDIRLKSLEVSKK